MLFLGFMYLGKISYLGQKIDHSDDGPRIVQSLKEFGQWKFEIGPAQIRNLLDDRKAENSIEASL